MTITLYMALYFIYLILTLLFGTIFTVLFLDIAFTRKHVIWLTGYTAISIVLQTGIGHCWSDEQVVMLYPFLVHVPLLLLCVRVFRRSVTISLSALFLSYFLTSLRYILGYCVASCIPSLPYPEITGRILVTVPLALVLWKYALTPFQKLLKRSQRENLLFFVPLALMYLLSYVISVYTDLAQRNPYLLMEILFTFLFCILFYYLQIYFVEHDRKRELESQQQVFEAASSSMDTQVKKLKEVNEQTRVLRHDMRHLCTLLDGYAVSGNTEKIQECLQTIDDKLRCTEIKNYCRNVSVNLILSSYLEPFEREKIPAEVTAQVPVHIPVSETDLCMLLANSLENAWHAVRGAVNPFLKVQIKMKQNILFFKMENTCEDEVSFVDGMPVAGQTGHGTGTRSIALIAEKYHGIYSFSQEEKTFITQVMISGNEDIKQE